MRLLLAAVAAVSLTATAACAQPAQQNPTAFMARHALEDGVHSLPTGVQYKVLSSGDPNGVHPRPQDTVTVNYDGRLLSGEVFDTTYNTGKPATFQLGGLIPGWVDVLQQMRPGDEWQVWIPPSRGYGKEATGPIPGNSVLVFKMQLISVLVAK